MSFGNMFIFEYRNVTDDPWESGRCKIRIYGRHDDEQKFPDDDLPWATFLQDSTSAATGKMGAAPVGAIVGSRGFGFFMDDAGQYPVIVGNFSRAGKLKDEKDNTGGQKDIDDKASDTPSQARSQGKLKNTQSKLTNKEKRIDYTDKPKYNNAPYPDDESAKELTETAKKTFVPKTMDLPTIAGINKDQADDILKMITQVDSKNESGALPQAPEMFQQIFQLDNMTSMSGLNALTGSGLGNILQSVASGNIIGLANMGALGSIGNLGGLGGLGGLLNGSGFGFLGEIVGQMSSVLGTFSSGGGGGGGGSSALSAAAQSSSTGIAQTTTTTTTVTANGDTVQTNATSYSNGVVSKTITTKFTNNHTTTISYNSANTLLSNETDIKNNLSEMINQLGGFKPANPIISNLSDQHKDILYQSLIHLANNTRNDLETVAPIESLVYYGVTPTTIIADDEGNSGTYAISKNPKTKTTKTVSYYKRNSNGTISVVTTSNGYVISDTLLQANAVLTSNVIVTNTYYSAQTKGPVSRYSISSAEDFQVPFEQANTESEIQYPTISTSTSYGSYFGPLAANVGMLTNFTNNYISNSVSNSFAVSKKFAVKYGTAPQSNLYAVRDFKGFTSNNLFYDSFIQTMNKQHVEFESNNIINPLTSLAFINPNSSLDHFARFTGNVYVETTNVTTTTTITNVSTNVFVVPNTMIVGTPPNTYLKVFSYQINDPHPGFIKWESPNGNDHIVYTRRPNNEPYVYSPSEDVINQTLPVFAGNLIVPLAKRSLTLDHLLNTIDQAYAQANAAGWDNALGHNYSNTVANSNTYSDIISPNNQNQGTSSGSGAGAGGGGGSNIIGALMGILGILGEDLQSIIQQHLPQSFLDVQNMVKLIEDVGQEQAITKRKEKMAKKAVQQKNQPPVSPPPQQGGTGMLSGLSSFGKGGMSNSTDSQGNPSQQSSSNFSVQYANTANTSNTVSQ